MRFWLVCILTVFTFSAFAGKGRDAWKQQGPRGQLALLKEYRAWIGQYEELKAGPIVQQWSLFSQAWAQEVMDCIFAGWPSQQVNGSCRSPSAVEESKYTQGSCAETEMQCQPLLFGEGLCASTASSSAKQSAFSQCDKAFKASEKTLKEVLDEVKSRSREQELLELFDFVDRICSEGKQSTTPMCRRLELVTTALKSVQKENVTEAIAVEVALVNRLVVINEAARSAGHAPIDCDPSQGVRVPVYEAAEQVVSDSVALPGFVRERSRDVACIGGTQGYRSYTYCGGDTVKTPAGFDFRHGNQPYRDIQFVSTDSARDGTHLYFHDGISEQDSHNGKSMMFLLPRLGVPQAVENGNEVSITLTTGEVVVMDKSTSKIIRGALQEGPFSTIMDRFLRPPPNVSYTGRGISIRVDHRYDYPTGAGGDATAEVRQGNRVCQVPRARLWDADGRLLAETDAQLVTVLNTACPASGSQQRFSIEGI